uniref:Nck-associated protein 5 C-terminal domain-containing protein n=1 Tax=Oncorhynchus tshawytscha TaxID=74940 RepID=A0A8C8C5C2_ONCTS
MANEPGDGFSLTPSAPIRADNSVLALANESQREAYERCLDEVANHVVQALLSQKDLREECIKLKMRVFDLERQNRTLTELFAQKLHPQDSSLQQVQNVSPSPYPQLSSASLPAPLIQVNWDHTQNGTAGLAPAPATSIEALSPFFKKKAHILEVLRKLEESDPLKFHPSSCLSPHHDLGQALVSMERDQMSLMSSVGLPSSHSLDSLLKCAKVHGAAHPGRVESLNGQAWAEDQGALAPSTGLPQAAALPHLLSTGSTSQCYMHKTAVDSLEQPPELLVSSDPISSLIEANLNGMLRKETRNFQRHKDRHPFGKPLPRAEVQPSHSEDVAVEFYSPAPVPERTSSAQALPPSGKSKLALSPTFSTGLGEVKPSTISSPSRLLKFLKIPTGMNQAQPGNPLRLSPQLTRSSKIPCRNNNNYEVYHSPVLTRKATTTEREKQLSSSPYTATHSAPTSPPKPEDIAGPPPTVKEIAFSSHFAPKPSHSTKAAPPSSSSSHTQRGSQKVPSQPICEPPQPTQSAARQGDRSPGSSTPKRLVQGKPQSESSHHPFKERLAALGKLKSTENLPVGAQPMDKKDAQSNVGKPPTNNIEKSKTAERQGERTGTEQHRHQKYTDSLEGKQYPKTSLCSHPRVPGPIHESGAKSSATPSSIPKAEQESSFSPRIYVAKADGPKIKMGTLSSNTETSSVVRSYGKCPITRSHHSKTTPSPQNSPTKVSSKSPSKVGQASSYPRGKTFVHAESFPPPPPLPPRSSTEAIMKNDKKQYSSGPPVPQSAIEQKVMRGIEENMLKLQEQDRGQLVEPKQKASNGIASWFGLRKSKLPALSRKPEVSKLKNNMSSSPSSSSASGGGAKDFKSGGPRKVVESLNISMLMEKAEDLRKALEEERAYVNGVGMDRSGRGHSCEVVMDQAQGQLSLMYRGASDMIGKDEVTSDESLAESISSQHITGSGASMRTLDSGIGTFPMPDYASNAAGKSITKGKPQGEQGFSGSQGKHGAKMKVSRKAHTLERELSSLDEVNPSILYGSGLEGKDIDAYGAHMQNPPTKDWTFPNLKGSAGVSDVYLDVVGDPGSQRTPSRRVSESAS